MGEIDAYTKDLARCPEPLSRDQERVLGLRIQRDRDEAALHELVAANLRFVVNYASRYQGMLPLPDLIQAGNVGLVTAARKFDPDRGVKFISYAVWWIRQAILRAAAEQGYAVRLPLNQGTTAGRVARAAGRLRQELGREPDVGEVATEVGLDVADVRRLRAATREPLRLDAPISANGDGGNGRAISEILPAGTPGPDAGVEEGEVAEAIAAALSSLPPRQALVLRLHYGLSNGGRPHTTGEVAAVVGVTMQRVRMILDAALDALRNGEHAHALAAVLDDLA